MRFGSRPEVSHVTSERLEHQIVFGQVLDGSNRRTVLAGQCGAGKSQLAAIVAAACEEKGWPLVAWINARDHENVITELAELGHALGLDLDQDLSLEELARKCLDTFSSGEPRDGLLVFDDVASPEYICDLVPKNVKIRVLATTRMQDLWGEEGWLRIPVGCLERAYSIGFLFGATGQDDRGSAECLAEEVGDLPLALAQIAANINFLHCTMGEYAEFMKRTTLAQAMRWRNGIYPLSASDAMQESLNRVLGTMNS